MVSASPMTAKSGHGVIFKHREEVFIVPKPRRGERDRLRDSSGEAVLYPFHHGE